MGSPKVDTYPNSASPSARRYALTLGATYGSRVENEQGSIRVGKRVDMAIFSSNFIRLGAEQIAEGRVAMTLAGGRIA
jgi:predicted amidohydrolase YtcJ